MIKRTLLFTTAAACLAASLIILFHFAYRQAAEPAFFSQRFCCVQAVSGQPDYEHMRMQMKRYRRYAERHRPPVRTERPLGGR